MAQLVKNLPVIEETPVRYLGLEGLGYPLQNSWASLVAEIVKNLPAMRETWIQFLGWKESLEKGMAAHTSTPTPANEET